MNTQGEKVSNGIFGFLHIIFTALAGLGFLAGVAVLLYDLSGIFRDTGFQFSLLADLLDWFWGPPPPSTDINSLLALLAFVLLLPAGVSLMALGWLLSKIADGFEALS